MGSVCLFFYDAISAIMPFIKLEDLEPEMAGIRPELSREGETERDFIISEESGWGLPGFINLIGIESPGLTATPAIADYVWHLIEELL
jgi:L-2-hydroxyglutarate oxidase LhgO